MSENITKYTTKIEFDSASALKKLAQYEKKLNAFNKKQGSLSKVQRSMKDRVSGRNTSNLMTNNINSGGSQTKDNMTAHLKERERHLLELERSKKRSIKLSQQELNSLNKAKETVKNTMWFRQKYNTQEEKAIILALRENMLKAKTAQQVRSMVATTKHDLRMQREKLRTLEKQNFLLRRMKSSSEQFAGNMVSAFAVGAGVAGVTRVGQQFESVNNTMLAVSTNAKEAGENFQFVRDEAYRLGLGLSESGKGFAKLVAARGNMSLEDTKEAFLGVAEASTLLGLSTEESTRAINALMQINKCLAS